LLSSLFGARKLIGHQRDVVIVNIHPLKEVLDRFVGALVVDIDGKIIAEAHNEREIRKDPTSHAEILALQAAAQKLGQWRLDGCTLIVSLEPCPMCAGALILSRIDRVVYGYVIDFLDFRIWPVFNIADSAITIGAVLIGWKCFRLSNK
jgi:tRNA(Arg) A34 adenosine deaminase TadA